jgi:putative endonuclease
MGYLYILRSEPTGTYYIGSTVNVSVRLHRHNSGHHISTKAFRPWKLIYAQAFETLTEARKKERQIKAWKNPAYMIKTLGIEAS